MIGNVRKLALFLAWKLTWIVVNRKTEIATAKMTSRKDESSQYGSGSGDGAEGRSKRAIYEADQSRLADYLKFKG